MKLKKLLRMVALTLVYIYLVAALILIVPIGTIESAARGAAFWIYGLVFSIKLGVQSVLYNLPDSETNRMVDERKHKMMHEFMSSLDVTGNIMGFLMDWAIDIHNKLR